MGSFDEFFKSSSDRSAVDPLVNVRLAGPEDQERVQAYFCSLSLQARYCRFAGGMRKLPPSVLEHFVAEARADLLTILVTIMQGGQETVVGEARYVLAADAARGELALSVHDRWQGRGIGQAMVTRLERHAVVCGVRHVFGETLSSNDRICRLAQLFGYVPATPIGGELLRFEKALPTARRRGDL